MWQSIIAALPDAVKSVFGVVDKLIPDKDKAAQIKLEILTTVAGKGATSWLAQNAFALAMLANFGLVIVLSLIGKPVPDWSLLVALLWLAGPLMNTLSKETLGKLMELYHDSRTAKTAGDNTPAKK